MAQHREETCRRARQVYSRYGSVLYYNHSTNAQVCNWLS